VKLKRQEASMTDLAALKGDVGAPIEEKKDLAFREGSRLGQNPAEKIIGSASDIYSGVSKQTIRSAEVVSEHVQDWPTPLLRMADPAEIGAAAAFLASSDSSFMTASELAVDGGLAQL
jgi:NAD(P)-dependent dehydrogenase (short-subunit alcohol dehydrogenase family)